MDLEIIPETPHQHAVGIEALYDATFGPGHFAKTAERLREGNETLPLINRLAVAQEGKIAGVCRVWPLKVETGGRALFFGPVAVDEAFRGTRLGLRLTEQAIDAATDADWPAALLIGAPSYFGEVGFQTVEPGRFLMPGPQDPARIMVRDLAGSAGAYRGKVRPAR